MQVLKSVAIIATLFGLAACDGPERFGSGGGTGSSGIGLGGADDPTSMAYFEEVVGDRVIFAVDQSTLSPQAKAILAAQARWLVNNPGFNAVLEGHADERGTTEYNLALGARRASAAQEYLFSQGIALTRMQTLTYGKERPAEICSDEVCYAQNRRTVTVLRAGPGV